MFNITSFVLLLTLATSVRAQTTGTDATAQSAATSTTDDALKALQDRNGLLEEEIKLYTNQQKLAQFYFPAIPQRLEPSFHREGVATLKGSVEAFAKLQDLARELAVRLSGVAASSGGPPLLVQDVVCKDLKKAELKVCQQIVGQANDASRTRLVAGGVSTTPSATRSYGPILIQGQLEAPGILELQGVSRQLTLLDQRIGCALDPISAACGAEPATGPSAAPGALAFVGPALQAVVDLVNFLRKKTSVSTFSLDPDAEALVALLAHELEQVKVGSFVYATTQFPVVTAPAESKLINLLESLHKRVAAIQRMIQSGETQKEVQDKASVKPEALIVLESQVSKAEAQIAHLEQLQIAASDSTSTLRRAK